MSFLSKFGKPPLPRTLQDYFEKLFGTGGHDHDGDNSPLIGKLVLQEDTPVNAVAADGTITFTGTVSDGEVVSIGDDTYEFDTGDGVADGNITVDVSGDQTASAAAAALNTAINGNATEDVSSAEGDGDTVDVTYDTKGAVGNEIDTTTDASNASWGDSTLTGGVDGTIGEKYETRVDGSYLYIAVDDNTTADTNWRRVDLSSAY